MVPIPLGQHLFDFCRHINRLTLQRTNCQCYVWMSLQSINSVVIYLGRCLISYKGHHYQFPDSATWRGNIMKMKYLITVTSNGRHDVSNYRRFGRRFVQQIIHADNKNTKAQHYWLYKREMRWWMVYSLKKWALLLKACPCHDVIMNAISVDCLFVSHAAGSYFSVGMRARVSGLKYSTFLCEMLPVTAWVNWITWG